MRNLLFGLLLFPLLSIADDQRIKEECGAFAQITNDVVMHRINGVPSEQVIPHMQQHGSIPEKLLPTIQRLVEFVYNPDLVIREASDVAAIIRGAYSECKKKAETELEEKKIST